MGRPSSWQTKGPTVVIRVPEAFALRLMDLAHAMDRGEAVLDTVDSNADVVQAAHDELLIELQRMSEERSGPRRTPMAKALRLLQHYQHGNSNAPH